MEFLIVTTIVLIGTRAMQKLLDVAHSLEPSGRIDVTNNSDNSSGCGCLARVKCAAGSDNTIVRLIQDLNGTHVMAKLIRIFADNQFLFDCLDRNMLGLACHKHGCCVLQRCYDVGTNSEKRQL